MKGGEGSVGTMVPESHRAHVALYGQRTRRLAAAAAALNSNRQTTFKVQGKNMRDRLYLLKDHFVSEDEALARRWGVEKPVSRTDELLVDVVEQMDEFERNMEHTREAAKLQKKLDADGEVIRRQAMEPRRDRPTAANSEIDAAKGSGSDDEVEEAAHETSGKRSASGSRWHKRYEMDSADMMSALKRREKQRLDVIERQLAVHERSLDQQKELMTFLLQKMP
ncbi:hypothetical protein I4F81_001134 [Pyropia yezoensis]|uniref:Uncharacterized protein n=1 Tax=Pyropia yezoensis TaxID=2788 RepID=A0ACC3BKS8_PYRYE|nr:hypothetical protein I4F81_001134 [Neopyropia yezoensis]